MTKEDLLEAMHKVDILMQPWVLYCNPDDAKELKERIPETVKLVPLSFIDKGTSYLVDREECEKELYTPEFNLLQGSEDKE